MIEIELRGLEALDAKFEKIRAKNYQRALDNAGLRFIRKIVRDYFQGERDPFLQPWAPFARTPSAARGGASAKLLQDTGALIQSIRHEARPNQLSMSAAVFYASFHNEGNPATNLPRRQFIPTERLPADWVKILDVEIERELC